MQISIIIDVDADREDTEIIKKALHEALEAIVSILTYSTSVTSVIVEEEN